MAKFTRRQAIKSIAIGTVGIAGIGSARTPLAGPSDASQAGSDEFTFVHLTDLHVRRQRRGDEGYRACVAHLKANHPEIEFALMGGDQPFDGLYTPRDEFEDAIGLYKDISDTLGFPYYNCIGNHDVLGLSARRQVPVDDPELGKKMFMNRMGMEAPYYSFDHKGWHFVVLDCIFEIMAAHGPSYEPRIGEEQLAWLARDLGRNAGKPTICVTHIAAFDHRGQIEGNFNATAMDPGRVLRDNRDLRLVMERHGVKALLQGHSHTAEDFHYRGVSYITSSAVSACWWGGTWRGFQNGYTIFRCKGDQFTFERHTFPWEHQFEPEDTLEMQRQAEWDAFVAEQAALAEQERRG